MSRAARSLLVPGLLWALVVAPARAAADAKPDAGELEALLGESVVTTASRTAERASVAPATVYTITADEMQIAGMRTVDEALEFLGLGLYITKPRDYTSGIDVGAQGLLLRDGGRHVLVLLDGVILNSQGTGRISIHEALGVPFDSIDHIEVMLGPGSVVYGSNAMLAVINVVTKRAKDYPRLHVGVELGSALAQNDDGTPTLGAPGTHPGLRYRLTVAGGARFHVGQVEGEASAAVEWTHELSETYGVTPFTMAEAGNQSLLPGQTSWGGMAHHTMRTPNGVLSVKLGDFRLMVNAFDYYRNMPLVGTFDDPAARESQSGVRIDLSHRRALGRKLTLTSRLYGGYARFAERSNYGEAFWCLPEQVHGCSFEMSARSGWVGAEQQLAADWLVDGKLVTTVGWDARLRLFDSTPAEYRDLETSALPTDLALPHANTTSFIGALFAQQVWRPLWWLNLNVGGRLDLDSDYGARLSPRAAVVFTPADRTTLRLSYSEAFRAPSAYEQTEFDPTYRITPGKLAAETVRDVELELQQRLWRLSFSLRGYFAMYDDFIESRTATADEVARFADRLSPTIDPANVMVNQNLTSLRVWGGSLSAQLPLPAGFLLGGSLNVARAYLPDGTNYDHMPLFFGNFRAGWRSHGGYSLMLVGVVAAHRSIVYVANDAGGSIGPRVDLRLTAAGPLGHVAGLSWRASVGFDANPQLPYAIANGTDTPSGVALYPDQPRLFGFVGARYDWGAR